MHDQPCPHVIIAIDGPAGVGKSTVAQRLADSQKPAPRWIGKDALRELLSPSVMRRIESQRGAKKH